MTKFRAALVTAALAFSLIGGVAGAASSTDAGGVTGKSITKVTPTAKDGTGWCC